jgi:hypothetical protein
MRFAFISVFAALMAVPAWACFPLENKRSLVSRGDACEVQRKVGGSFHIEGLSPTEKLGEGYVLQEYYSGTGCSFRLSSIVFDCEAGEAVVFGPALLSGYELSEEDVAQWEKLPYRVLQQTIAAKAREGRSLSIDEIQKAASEDFPISRIIDSSKFLRIAHHPDDTRRRYDLSCACEQFGAESFGGNE